MIIVSLMACIHRVISGCDSICGCGYQFTTLDVEGPDSDKEWTYPGEGIENCANECNQREGCTSFEYNHEGNWDYRCATFTGGQSNLYGVREKTHLDWQTCVVVPCDPKCGCGYKYSPKDIDFEGKAWFYPGEGVELCAALCTQEEGCTGFEYNFSGTEDYKCGLYTGGASNLRDAREGGTQHAGWLTCVAADAGIAKPMPKPKGESCGKGTVCDADEFCCDPLCGKCIPNGSMCTQGCDTEWE